MWSLDDLLAVPTMRAEDAAAALGADVASCRPITGYGGLTDVEALDSDPPGIRLLLRGGDVALLYVGVAGLPQDLDHAALTARFGADATRLRSRQGKRAALHLHAEEGVAWSELDGEVGFLELFPPMAEEAYLAEIHVEPPPFRQ